MVREVEAVHILVKTEEKAKELRNKIILGASFEDLAREFSICPSGKKGGNLGWFGRGMMVREFENTAFTLQKGVISQPVKSQFGWHLIKVINTK